MSKLSKREKSMLIVLGIVLVASIAFMFVIQPIMNAAAENKSVIADLEVQLADARMAVAQEAAINKRLDEAIKYVNDEGRTFYSPMTTWDAERHVVKILHENKVEYHAVSISDPVDFVDTAIGGDANATTDETVKKESNGVRMITMTIQCQTTMANFSNMLDDFHALEKKGCITNWDYINDEVGNGIKANITVSLYSIE